MVTKRRNMGSLVLNNQVYMITHDCTVTHDKMEYDYFSNHEIPDEIHFTLKGRSLDGKRVDIRFTCKDLKNNLLSKIDVLSELPFLVRKFIQTFVTAPYVYQFLLRHFAIDVIEEEGTADESLIRMNGHCFVEATFMQ